MTSSPSSSSIERVCVIGAGLMGSGIATVCAFHGYPVVVVDMDERALVEGKRRVSSWLAGMQKKEKGKKEEKMCAPGRIQWTLDLARAVRHGQEKVLIVEAIVENLEAKRALFQRVRQNCAPNALLATNTSSLLIADVGHNLGKMNARFAGVHFFNPVPKMALVEVIPSVEMPTEVVGELMAFVKSIGKVPIVCKDTPGFIANRILIPLMAEAMGLVERGVATPEAVDKACELGLGLPIGPFRLLDFVGLDTAQNIIKGWTELYAEEFPNLRQSTAIGKLVAEGKKGRKTGEGFYKYSSKL